MTIGSTVRCWLQHRIQRWKNRTSAPARLILMFWRLRSRRPLRDSSAPEFLIELDETAKMHPLRGLLAITFGEEIDARPVAFSPGSNLSLSGLSPLFSLRQLLNYNWFKSVRWVYWSFGASKHVVVRPTAGERHLAKKWGDHAFSQLSSKQDLVSLHFDGIRIGDLACDQFLRASRSTSLDIRSRGLRLTLIKLAENLLFWKRYLDSHHVAGICVSHGVYGFAVPLRVGLRQGIACFKTFSNRIVRLSEANQTEGLVETWQLKAGGPAAVVKSPKIARIAKEVLEIRLYRDPSHGLDYMGSLEFDLEDGYRFFRESSRPFVGVFCHVFDDAPHIHGDMLFPDFWDWIEFVLSQTKFRRDTDFLVKPHPLALPAHNRRLREAVSKFENVEVISSRIRHTELADLGMQAGFTVHGTVAHELAYLGVPVVNASLHNPHHDFHFSVTPQTRDNLGYWIQNYEQLEIPQDQEEVLDFCAARFPQKLGLHHVCRGIVELEDPEFSGTLKDVNVYKPLVSSAHGICDRYFTALKRFVSSGETVFYGARK